MGDSSDFSCKQLFIDIVIGKIAFPSQRLRFLIVQWLNVLSMYSQTRDNLINFWFIYFSQPFKNPVWWALERLASLNVFS